MADFTSEKKFLRRTSTDGAVTLEQTCQSPRVSVQMFQCQNKKCELEALQVILDVRAAPAKLNLQNKTVSMYCPVSEKKVDIHTNSGDTECDTNTQYLFIIL